MSSMTRFLTGAILLAQMSCSSPSEKRVANDWVLGPFQKADDNNPVLIPQGDGVFFCPVRGDSVRWEIKDVFNPASLVRNDTVFLLYRAEDTVGIYAGTSRIGLAFSTDAVRFQRLSQPVFYPDNDFMYEYEWEGGCEDPRIVQREDGVYILTYSSYDGKVARLCVASSPDLIRWTKHGLAFGETHDGKFKDLWSKSGSIVYRLDGERMVAVKMKGYYWMYWGDTHIYGARSTDLFNWEPLLNESEELISVFGPRPGKFDSDLVEPGPPALLTEKGIVLIYNSRNRGEGGDPGLPEGTYAAGQVLLDPNDPLQVLARTDEYFIFPDREYEITGQIGNVCFVEGMVFFKGRWWIYYGTADSKIAAASSSSL